jgi:hypothetical protein
MSKGKERKARSDKGVPRKANKPDDVLVQVRLNETKPREADALDVWNDFVAHYGNDKRCALTEVLIAAGEHVHDGWVGTPPNSQLTTDMVRMLSQAMELMDRLSHLDFSASPGSAEDVTRLKDDAAALGYNATCMMGGVVFFDEDGE